MVTNATQASLEAALSQTNWITFGFNGTIPLVHTLVITTNLTLDATGRQIYLDGQNLIRHFTITNGAALRLINLAMINGYSAGTNGPPSKNGSPDGVVRFIILMAPLNFCIVSSTTTALSGATAGLLNF